MHNKNNNKTFGFSLIELMVTIAIIGILSSIAVPTYIGYTNRSNVTNALPILQGLQQQVSDYYNANNCFPANLTTSSAAGCPTGGLGGQSYSDTMIASTSVSAAATGTTSYGSFTPTAGTIIGYVQATFNSAAPVPSDLQGTTLTIVAMDNGGTITWKCLSVVATGSTKAIISTYLPSSCQ